MKVEKSEYSLVVASYVTVIKSDLEYDSKFLCQIILDILSHHVSISHFLVLHYSSMFFSWIILRRNNYINF